MISKTTSIKRPALLVFGLLCASCGSSGKSGADGGADVSDTSGDTKLSDILPDSGHGDLGLHDLGRGDSSGPDANDTQLADLASDLATGPDTLDVQDDTSGITGQEETTLKVLFPTADRFEQVVDGDGRHFEAFQGETSLGLAFQAGAYGFNSEVICMTAITPVGITVALEVVSQYESWWFQVQWDTAFFRPVQEPDRRDPGCRARELGKCRQLDRQNRRRHGRHLQQPGRHLRLLASHPPVQETDTGGRPHDAVIEALGRAERLASPGSQGGVAVLAWPGGSGNRSLPEPTRTTSISNAWRRGRPLRTTRQQAASLGFAGELRQRKDLPSFLWTSFPRTSFPFPPPTCGTWSFRPSSAPLSKAARRPGAEACFARRAHGLAGQRSTGG